MNTEPTCFFCNEPAGSAVLHNASTYSIDVNVRRIALELEDTALLAKLAAGDMIAIEAKYHHDCLRSLYNRARKAAPKGNDEDDSCLHGIAFSELVAFLEDNNSDEDTAPVFKLVDLTEMYKVRLEQLGVTVEKRIHTTRLKNRLLTVLPDLRAYSQGRDTLLSFEKNIGPAWLTHCSSWGCVSPTTGCYNLHPTLPMVSANALGWKMLCAHQSCVKDCSQQELWTTLTTIQVLQPPKILSMVQESRLCSICHTQMVELIVVYQ